MAKYFILVLLGINITNAYAATPSAPVIRVQPVNGTVTAPAKATFSVSASGSPSPSYRWMQNVDGVTFTNISGATKASYTTAATTLADSGTQYECVVSNASGSVTSNAATLTVNVVPSITTQPSSLTVTAPATATFTVVANGTPAPSYQWQQELPGTSTYTAIAEAINASYTTSATMLANSGTKFECVISNVAGFITSKAAILTVDVVPSITVQPVNGTVTAPAKATFSVTASGTPSPSYQWMQSVDGVTFTNITGATKASYTTAVTTLADSGTQYECVVSNASGSVTSNAATLTVNVVPSITTQPSSLTVTAPATATFAVIATGTPSPTYQWMQKVKGGTYTNIPGAMSASYTIAATTEADNRTKYKCVVSNAAGSVTSEAAALIVDAAPNITVQPLNMTVTAPATATFTVMASGKPKPKYQWMQSVDGMTFTKITGAKSSSYTTPATTTSISGTQYECEVSNSLGSIKSAAATLTVNSPVPVAPVINIQPMNATVTVPDAGTFTVVASGTAPLTYQWQQGLFLGRFVQFQNIPGATNSSYTTSPTTAGQGSLYQCVISNQAGSVTSNIVHLTVNATPLPAVTITSPSNNSAFSAGSSVVITAIADEDQGSISSVSFYNEGVLLGTSTVSPYSITVNNLPVGVNSITTTATDPNGNSTASSPVTINIPGAPAVKIVSPRNQNILTAGSVYLTAIAMENFGTISKVTFYNGTTPLGTISSNSQAFTFPWTNISSGTYNLTAVATDSTGAMVTSSVVTATINSSPFTYSIDDNIFNETDALNHITAYQYDNDNRLLKTTFADGSTVSAAYDLFGNQISVTDQRGNILTKTYDPYERLSQTQDPLGGTTKYNYDTDGHLLTLTDANNNPNTYTYDPNGNVLTQTNALNFTTAFTYDLVGNVSSRTDADGHTTTYAYDALNRLTNTAYPDRTSVSNVYDALGRKISMTDSTGQTAYTYDALSRLLSKTDPADNSITYTYDSEGNRLTSVDQNNRTITNTYDTLNRLSSVTDPSGTTAYEYNAVSNKISASSPNGVTESYTYDSLNRVIFTVNSTSSGVLSSFTNAYDIAGMITKKTLQDGSWTVYNYDALNRLLEETRQTSTSIVYDYVYTYDPVGNRLTWTKNTTLGDFWTVDSLNMSSQVLTNMTNAGYGSTANSTQAVSLVRNYTFDAGNRLSNWNYAADISTSAFPIQTDAYTYDQNGNRLTKQAVLTGESGAPQQTSYAYDFENRLNQLNYTNISNITGTQTDNLFYNGEGLRTQAVLNNVAANYLYDGSNVLVERDGSGNTTKTYTRGLDLGGGIGSLIAQNIMGSNPAVQYYDYNDLGSTADLTTTTGTSAASYTYDAFGNLLTPQVSSDTNRYLFSTKEFDSRSGLDYFGKRYYDPEIGRWLTSDPWGFRGGQINLYVYVNNNPVNLVDPYGLMGENAQQSANQSNNPWSTTGNFFNFQYNYTNNQWSFVPGQIFGFQENYNSNPNGDNDMSFSYGPVSLDTEGYFGASVPFGPQIGLPFGPNLPIQRGGPPQNPDEINEQYNSNSSLQGTPNSGVGNGNGNRGGGNTDCDDPYYC